MDRKPSYIERQVADIAERDVFVCVAGLIVSKGENSFMLDDGTGQIPVVMGTELNGFVRVFGRIVLTENGYQLEGEIIQDLNKIDNFLYKKVKELMR